MAVIRMLTSRGEGKRGCVKSHLARLICRDVLFKKCLSFGCLFKIGAELTFVPRGGRSFQNDRALPLHSRQVVCSSIEGASMHDFIHTCAATRDSRVNLLPHCTQRSLCACPRRSLAWKPVLPSTCDIVTQQRHLMASVSTLSVL